MADKKKAKGARQKIRTSSRTIHDSSPVKARSGRFRVPGNAPKPTSCGGMIVRQKVGRKMFGSNEYSEQAWRIDFNGGTYSTRIRLRVGTRKQSRNVVVTEQEIFETHGQPDGATQELLQRKLTEARDMLYREMTA